MATSRLEQAIYLANNLPQGEYEVDSSEVYTHGSPTRPHKSLLWKEWNRFDEQTDMVIDKDYEQLMASGVEIIRHLLGLLVECRKSVFGAPVSPELADALHALDDYDPQPQGA